MHFYHQLNRIFQFNEVFRLKCPCTCGCECEVNVYVWVCALKNCILLCAYLFCGCDIIIIIIIVNNTISKSNIFHRPSFAPYPVFQLFSLLMNMFISDHSLRLSLQTLSINILTLFLILFLFFLLFTQFNGSHNKIVNESQIKKGFFLFSKNVKF